MAKAYFKNNDTMEDNSEKDAALIKWCITELER